MTALIAHRRIAHHLAELLVEGIGLRGRVVETEGDLLGRLDGRGRITWMRTFQALDGSHVGRVLELLLLLFRWHLREVVLLKVLDTEHTEDVVDDRRGELDVRMTFDDALWLEARERELPNVGIERHAVLKTHRDTDREAVHQRAERGAFLVHVYEDLTERAVHVFACAKEDFVPSDACFLREAAALLGKTVAPSARGREPLLNRSFNGLCGRGSLRLGARVFILLALGVVLGVEGLRRLRAVPIERNRLETELPTLFVDLLHVFDGRFVGQVHRLGDRAREKRLSCRHHVDVRHGVDESLADLAAAVGAVEDRKVLGSEMRRAFDRHTTDDDVVELADLFFAVPPEAEQVKARLVVGGCVDPETLVGLSSDHPGRQCEADIEHATEGSLGLFNLALRQAIFEQRLSTAVGSAGKGVGTRHVRNDVRELSVGVAEPLECVRNALVHDLEVTATCELLELHQREVGLDAGRVAVHQKADRSGRRQHGGL